MFFEKKSKNILNVICNLGIFGFMFLFGGMYTYVYFYGTVLLEACVMVFIGSTLLVIQYYFLRNLDFKERIPEILIIVIANVFSLFIIKQNVTLVAVIIAIATAACVLINRKKIGKIENIYM
ncbi:hypothetical protein [Bacillus cereus]|uniref:hypothetical protein n=1 Tax=Bacillus cereus TaxID=1396 RepID=UPI0025711107|nr:hypothetical protein [Bacillus cereus]WJE23250.1 hypothetical protein QRE65_02505 [Bacillus cereus]